MKIQLLALSSLLMISGSLSAAQSEKIGTLTKQEQSELNLQLVDAVNASDWDRIRELLNKGVLRDTQDYGFFRFDHIKVPREVMHVFLDMLEKFFQIEGDIFEMDKRDGSLITKRDGLFLAQLKRGIIGKRQEVEQKRLDRQLIRAAKAGDTRLVRDLLKRGASIVTDCDNQLERALEAGDKWLVTELLKRGAAISTNCDYPSFYVAAARGDTDTLNVLLDELENNFERRELKHDDPGHPDNYAYKALEEVKKRRHAILPLFKRDISSLDGLVKCVKKLEVYMKKLHSEGTVIGSLYSEGAITDLLSNLLGELESQLARNTLLSLYSSHNTSLHLSLVAAGAQQMTNDVEAGEEGMLDKQTCLDHCLFTGVIYDDELLKALIDEGANVNASIDEAKRQALHFASKYENLRAVKLLLRAGAQMNTRDILQASPLYIGGVVTLQTGAAKLLLEAGATVADNNLPLLARTFRDHSIANMDDTTTQKIVTTLLEASLRRYAPTKHQAKIALQNVAFLIYIFGIKCNLPPYVIYELLLFATAEQHNEQGELIAPEWTTALKRDLEVIYLYRCNGNTLRPLWEQTMRCIEKDPQKQALLISKLEHFMRPFLGNDVISIVSLSLMRKVAQDFKGAISKDTRREILEDNFDRYNNHLKNYVRIPDLEKEM